MSVELLNMDCVDYMKGLSEDAFELAISAECKLNLGMPMLYTEDAKFRERWKAQIKGRFEYKELLSLMDWFPLTSLMSDDQGHRYIERIRVIYGVE